MIDSQRLAVLEAKVEKPHTRLAELEARITECEVAGIDDAKLASRISDLAVLFRGLQLDARADHRLIVEQRERLETLENVVADLMRVAVK